MLEVILKRFENPDETRMFEKGRFDIIRIGGMTIGRASYEPRYIFLAPTITRNEMRRQIPDPLVAPTIIGGRLPVSSAVGLEIEKTIKEGKR